MLPIQQEQRYDPFRLKAFILAEQILQGGIASSKIHTLDFLHATALSILGCVKLFQDPLIHRVRRMLKAFS